MQGRGDVTSIKTDITMVTMVTVSSWLTCKPTGERNSDTCFLLTKSSSTQAAPTCSKVQAMLDTRGEQAYSIDDYDY
jgi:hypothetical protein